jgi:hypothetical protein
MESGMESSVMERQPYASHVVAPTENAPVSARTKNVLGLINGNRLDAAIRDRHNGRLNFRLLGQLLRQRGVVRPLYFRKVDTISPPLGTLVERHGMELVCAPGRAGFSVATYAFALAKEFDGVVIVGAGETFWPLLRVLRSRHHVVELWMLKDDPCRELRRFVDAYVELSRDIILQRHQIDAQLFGQAA